MELPFTVSASNRVPRYLNPDGSFSDGGDLYVNHEGSHTGTVKEWKLTDLETIKELGSGSFGTVRLAKHKHRKGQLFAVKVVQLKFDEEEAIAKELKINQLVQSPYVVRCYDFFLVKNEFSILLEYMDCGTLADLLKKVKQIPEPHLAAICKQLLKGLANLHYEYEQHIIHRDLKPSNLLINQKGEIKISDFGVSAIIANTYGIAETYTGTRLYTAPERIDHGFEHNIRSDIWSLGLLMLEVATGHFPYHIPDQSHEYLFLETIVDKPPPSASPDQFSTEFCSFISSCLQKDPNDRLSAPTLLEHPFVKKYNKKRVDLSSYFKKTLRRL